MTDRPPPGGLFDSREPTRPCAITSRLSRGTRRRARVVTASADTCPDGCSLKGAGCYAEQGPLAIHWRRTDEQGLDFDALCQRIRRLPRRQLWRYGQAGDLPGKGDWIDAAALLQLAKANAGRPVLAYTHKPTTPENLDALHKAAAAGFLVNLSADHPLQADDFAGTGLPVVTVLPSSYGRGRSETLSAFRTRLRDQPKLTPAGRRIAICPGTYTDTTCASCQACAGAARGDVIIGFPAHGTKAASIDRRIPKFGRPQLKPVTEGQ